MPTAPRTAQSPSRPFSILGVQQIAIGGTDKTKLRRLWVELLGVRACGEYRNESENVDEDILETGIGLGRVEIDLMQPLRPDERPRVQTPPLNHIGLWVDDLNGAYAWLRGQGVHFAPGGIRRGAAGHDICFIHPKGSPQAPESGQGVLIELVQAPQTLIDAARKATPGQTTPAVRGSDGE